MFNNLTSIQQQFRTLNQIQENDCAYNIISSVKIVGKLDQERLIESWMKVVLIIPLFKDFDIKQNTISVHNCSNETEALSFIKTLINKPFDLEKEVPVKACIITINPNLNIFVLIQHHIVTDLHSVNIISKVLAEIYNSGFTNITFKTYRENFNELELKKQDTFWKDYMDNPPNPLVLPTGKSSRSNFNGLGTSVFKSFTANASETIKLFSTENSVQPFLLLFVSYAVFLYKISGQNDFFIGVPFSNRRDNERKEMYGPFINILPVRVSINDQDTFISLYQKIRKQMLLLHRNQETPLQEIAKHYKCNRDLKIPYFLQAGFTQETAFTLDLDGLNYSTINIRPDGTQMDLFFTYWYENNNLECRWEYNTQAFTETQVISWQESYEKILNCLLKDSSQQLNTIPFISEKDINSSKDIFNQQIRNYPLEKSFSSHLIECYDNFSENIAIKDEINCYTYNAFSQNVKKYSNYFYNNVGTGNIIAIVLNRSIDRIAIIHAIICSGNSYLPIDAIWPKDRIQFLISKADVKLTIIDEKLLNRIPQDVICTQIEELKALGTQDRFPDIIIKPDDPIAVLYTSGSTGNPKGVVITGKGITNRLLWMQETYPIGVSDKLIHKVPYTFDVSIWEIFWSFLTGGALFIPDPIRHIDDKYLTNVIRENSITYVHFVPSLLKKFFTNTDDLILPDLKGIICSGEALEVSLVNDFYKKLPGKALHNLYGPTEASIDVTAWTCSPLDIERSQIPIGYPIANTRIYILNEDKLLCPPYVNGEIAIAGVNLALGYVNNTEETSKHFIKGDWGWGEETIYLTGDLGYSNEDCCVQYIGRKDFQIKINGIRVELQEIERQLEQHPSINSAVVLVNENIHEENQLAAYLIQAAPIDIDQLRRELISFLPGYMIPNFYHFLDEYPMLNNGKIDRQKLVSIPLKKKSVEKKKNDSNQLSNNEYELMNIWQKILNIEDISKNSNFFDLGGHSSLLPLLKTEIEKVSGNQIELISLFKFPTISSQVLLFSNNKIVQETEKVEYNQREKMRRVAIRNRKSHK